MSKYTTILNSFAGGEISDRLTGRTDLAKYFSSVRTMTNMLPTAVGFANSRSGTKYITTVGTSNFVSQLVPFEATTEANYLLEFTDGYFRIFADDSPILHTAQLTNNTFDSDLTGWTDRSAGSSSTSQSGGVANLTVVSSAESRLYQAIDDVSVHTFTVTVDVTGGTVTGKAGTTLGGSELGSGSLSGASATFNFTNTLSDQRVYIEFETTTTATIDNVVLSTPEYRIYHPYTETDLTTIKYAQYNDLLYIVHPNHKPRILQRISNDKWRFTPWDVANNTAITLDTGEAPYLDLNHTDTTITPSAVTGSVTLTASADLFSSTDVGRLIRYKGSVSPDDDYTYTGTGAQTYFKIPFFPQTQNDLDVIIYNSNGGAINVPYENPLVTLARYTIDGPIGGYYYVHCPDPYSAGPLTTSQTLEIKRKNSGSAKWGYARITGYTSATEVTAVVLSELSGTRATTDWQLGAFSGTTGYPSAVSFHDQRLVFGSTTAQPQTIWMSATGDFGDFAPDSDKFETITDATSLTLTMSSSKLAKIRWFKSRGELLLGTTGGIYSIKPSSAVGISPLSPPTLKLESSIDCANIDATVSENAIIFVDINKRKVFDVAYNLQNDGYVGSEMNLLSDHILESPLAGLTFTNNPHPIFWGYRTDGKLVSCLYLRNQDVIGWALHELGGDGLVKSIQSLKTSTSEDVYMIVERTVDGSTVHYIEKIMPEFRHQEAKEAFFVDAGLTLDQTENTYNLTIDDSSVGTGRTFTASGSKFIAGDVGKYLKNTNGDGYALITAYTSSTIVTCTILTEFTSTSIAAGSWAVSATEISGLGHLEGEDVSIWADGATLPDATVASGAITVGTPIFYANIGLSYTRLIKSNRLDFPTKLGTVQGSIGRIHELTIRLFESSALLAGSSQVTVLNVPFETTTTLSFRDTTSVLNNGLTLFTGDKNVLLPSDFSKDVNYILKSTTPAPLTIVAVMAKCIISVT